MRANYPKLLLELVFGRFVTKIDTPDAVIEGTLEIQEICLKRGLLPVNRPAGRSLARQGAAVRVAKSILPGRGMQNFLHAIVQAGRPL